MCILWSGSCVVYELCGCVVETVPVVCYIDVFAGCVKGV